MSVRFFGLARAAVGVVAAQVALTALLAFATSPAVAQDFPNKPIRFLQGFPAGGNADVLVRVLGDELSRSMGQPVLVEARPGASGNLASQEVARATPDGYTLVLLTTAHVISPALMKSLNFDPITDFEFVSKVADYPFFIAVHNDSPYKTLNELIAAAKAKPGALTWGSAGTGSGQHMGGELLALSAEFKAAHVPFRGDAGSVTALLSKSIDYIVAPSTVLIGNIQGGNFRALAITSRTRAQSLPDVPTIEQSGIPAFDMQAFASIATTKGVPAPIVERLTKEINTAIAKPAVAKRIIELGGIPAPNSGPEMRAFAEAQVKRWKDVVGAAGIKQE